MTTPRHQRISDLFLEAAELSADERQAFLERECADDPELRDEVESLLAQEESASGILGDSPVGSSALRDELERVAAQDANASGSPASDSPPFSIANYRLLQRIGEGGMGEVWEARQEEPLRRRVAIKIIKWGMDTKQVVARFEAERQALGLMDHPNIAKVLDAGATEQGRPYFVMEYVRGVPITEHCDRHRVRTRERLELFLQVCEAIQHAHQKAIIHRDIKPSNVLVYFKDGTATPKIIDFGVAKATAQRLTERTVFTELGQLIGTPEYMSPEQAEMTFQDVDTRTDVYSLGVLLYQLLAGTLPFDSRGLRSEGLDEIRRRIREDVPPRPSRRVTTGGKESTQAADRRRADLPEWTRQLRGDLDWITMKAMEKDRSRRYGSPHELAADIRRHLTHQPVEAGPPSAAYRLGKFVRRHRTGVAAAGLVLLTLVLGIAGSTAGLIRAIKAERMAAREAETAVQISGFLEGLFNVSDPGVARGNTVTAREILDRGIAEIGQKLGDQPLVQARLMGTMGRVYRSLGLYDPAAPLLERALESRRTLLGDVHPDVAESLTDLATLRWEQGDLVRARPLLEEALEIRERLLGPEHELTAMSLHDLAVALWSAGDNRGAKPLLDRSLRIRENVLPPDHPDIARSLNVLGAWHYREGDFEAAGDHWQRTLEVQEKSLGADHPELAMTLNNLALVRRLLGDPASARTLLERVIEIQEKSLGPEHPNLAAALNNLGELLLDLGAPSEARTLFEQSVAIQTTHGSEHPEMGRFLRNLGRAASIEKDFEEAGAQYERSLAVLEKALGAESPEVAWTLRGVGDLHAARGMYEEAERSYRRALAIWEESLGPTHHATAVGLLSLATLYSSLERYDEAEDLFRRSLELLERSTGSASPDVARARQGYAELLRRSGRPAAADELAPAQ